MKDKKLIIAVIAFALVLVLTLVSTYAYFTATASGNGAEIVNVKTGSLGIEYTHGQKVESPENVSDNLHENWDLYLPLIVESKGTVEQAFNILWDNITMNEIIGYANLTDQIPCAAGSANCTDVRSDFTYKLYELPTQFNDSNATNIANSISSGTQIATSFLYGVQSEDIIKGRIRIEPQEIQYYVLHIHFNYDPNRVQNYQQNKIFNGNIRIDLIDFDDLYDKSLEINNEEVICTLLGTNFYYSGTAKDVIAGYYSTYGMFTTGAYTVPIVMSKTVGNACYYKEGETQKWCPDGQLSLTYNGEVWYYTDGFSSIKRYDYDFTSIYSEPNTRFPHLGYGLDYRTAAAYKLIQMYYKDI